MPAEKITLFRGDGRASENPHVFIKLVKQNLSHANSDTDRIDDFKDYLFPSSPAEQWYDKLMEGEMPPATWKALVAKFEEQWPKPAPVMKGEEDYVTELSAYKFPEEDLGKKVERGGVEMWSHMKMAEDLEALAHSAGIDDTNFLVVPVWQKLPGIIQEQVPSKQKDWTAFCNAIREVDAEKVKARADKLRKEKEKEEERMKKEKALMEKYDRILGMAGATPETPTRGLTNHFATANLGTNGPTYGGFRGGFGGASSRGRGRFGFAQRGGLFGPAQRGYTRITEEQRTTLRQNVTALPRHPNTTAGRQAYETQKAEWSQRWGGNATPVTYERPYPLEPGTSNVCTGECFQCGKCGHRGDMCQNRTLNEKEKAWRQLCSNELGPYL
ncbi:hypothetical protein D9758_016377 [Tetrapyrgos nigripes]|uniref:CCHC-type domain-containing protein n=1 Tax=Tetrapyrgos nigripes TaxID=182062 RepID=A0A8H5CFD3_9AGAR|nr:hypothetical protein D9758_016377 [Tetrapyrgos nigripes]